MHNTTSPTPTINAIVATARTRAHLAARRLRRLDPFRNEPGIAHVSDLCALLEGPYLLREDTVLAIEGLAARVAVRLEPGMRQGRLAPLHEALETLLLTGDGHAAETYGG